MTVSADEKRFPAMIMVFHFFLCGYLHCFLCYCSTDMNGDSLNEDLLVQ